MRIDDPEISGTIYYSGMFLDSPSVVHTFFSCILDQGFLNHDIEVSVSEDGMQMILVDSLYFEDLVNKLPMCSETDEIMLDLDSIINMNQQYGVYCIEYIAYFTKIIPFVMPYDDAIKAKIGYEIYEKLRDVEIWCDDYKEYGTNKALEKHSHSWTPF